MDGSLPLVSVLILNYNGERYLKNCLQSVLTNIYPNFEVVLVDNASKDSSLKNAVQQFGADKRLKIVVNNRNLGFSGGNNVGFKQCRGEYVVFLNNDTTVEKDWLTKLVEAMKAHPEVGLAQSKIVNMHNQQIQNAGWLFSNYLLRKHSVKQQEPQNAALPPIYEVSVASGACMIAPRQVLAEVGLFEAEVPFFYDDTLLSFKVWLSGRKVVTIQASQIRHIMGATSNWNTERTTYNLQKAKTCLLFDLYPDISGLAAASFINLVHTAVGTVFLVRQKRAAAISGSLRGVWWSLWNLPFLWRTRSKHWKNAKVSPKELQDRFFKVRLPAALFLAPCKLSNAFYARQVEEYEKAITKQQNFLVY